MSPLDLRAADLRNLVQEIVRQFTTVGEVAAHGPCAQLNMQEHRVVELLGYEGPKMMRELSDFLGIAVNSVTTVVDSLERQNLAVRQRSAEDRRVVRVELTEDGRAAFQMSDQVKLRFLRSILGALTEDEQEIFMVLFRKISRAGRSQVQQLSEPTNQV
jgi:DNA-binding MarR family transcriptional regulator